MSIFSKLSYYEIKIEDDLFLNRFPSGKTVYSGVSMEKKAVFPSLQDKATFDASVLELSRFLTALNSIQGNFYDFFWFVPASEPTTSANIIHWMSTLYFQSNGTIVSSKNPDFSLSVHLKTQSLPGQAIDAPPIFKAADGNRFVTLGYKKKPKQTDVVLHENAKITVSGLSGYVLYGEHLEPSETSKMDDFWKQYQDQGTPIKMEKHNASAAYRALMEEGGFQIGASTAYYVGKDSYPGRDARYWEFDTFGYKRGSESHMVCVVVEGNPPDTLPEPVDTEECSKGVILPVEVALAEFRVGGAYPPAFPAHVNQLKHCLGSV